MNENINRTIKSIPRGFAVAIPAAPGPVKLADIYGSNIPSPIPRPNPSGGNRRPARVIPRPFPWEKPIPINTRDIEYELRRYTDPAEKRVARWLYSTWNAQRDAIKFQEIRNAIRDGALSRQWIDDWKQDYSDYVNNVLAPEWRNGWSSGGNYMAGQMADNLGISWRFPAMTNALRDWVTNRGASLAVNLTNSQTTAIRNILEHYGVREAVGPRALDKYIRPVIGLTSGEAAAVARRRDLLTARGLKPKQIDNAVENYSGFLLRRRGLRIARTETAFAYNYGALDAVREARNQGLIRAQRIEKDYVTAGDERTCPFCSELDAQTIELEETFPGVTPRLPNVLVPPVHPNCRCVIVYNVVGLDETPAPAPTPTPTISPPVPPVVAPVRPRPKPAAPVKPPDSIPPAIPTAETWKPAETIDDALERLGEHTEQITFTKGIQKYIDDKVSDEELLAYYNTMDAELTRCRSFANLDKMKKIEINGSVDAAGSFSVTPDRPTMWIHGRMSGQPLDTAEDIMAQLTERIGKTVGSDVIKKIPVPSRDVAFLPATVRHEWGHYVFESGTSFPPPALRTPEIYSEIMALRNEVKKMITRWRRKKLMRNYVSEYAQTGPAAHFEGFAEMFVIYTSPKFKRGSMDAVLGKGTENLIQRVIDSAVKLRGRK